VSLRERRSTASEQLAGHDRTGAHVVFAGLSDARVDLTRTETTGAFAPAFERACAAGRSAVLELVTDPDQITPDRRLSA